MDKKLTKEQQKEIAIARMKQMDIYAPYVKEFEKNQTVTMFENFGGFWATEDNNEGELEQIIRNHEAKSGDMVYAVTHELTNFGELYSMLIVSSYAEDESNIELDSYENIFYPFAFVYNKDEELFSEYGTIGVKSFGGGIKRVE